MRPSCASKETSLNACTAPNFLLRPSTANHGAGAVRDNMKGVGRMLRTQPVVELRRRARCNEFRGQPRDAAGRELPVALPGERRGACALRRAFHDLVRVALPASPDRCCRTGSTSARCSAAAAPKSGSTGPRGHFSQTARMPRMNAVPRYVLRQRLFRHVLLRPARRVFAADDGEVHALGDLLFDVALDAQILRGQRLRIAQRLRFVDQQRQRRDGFIGVAEQSNRGAEARIVERRARESRR